MYLKPPELHHKPPLIAPQNPPNCTKNPSKMYHKTPRNVPPPRRVPKNPPKSPPPRQIPKNPQNVPKTPVNPPKCTPTPPREVFWYILGVFLVHFSRGGGGLVHFAPERGVFWYKVGGFLVCTTINCTIYHTTNASVPASPFSFTSVQTYFFSYRGCRDTLGSFICQQKSIRVDVRYKTCQ